MQPCDVARQGARGAQKASKRGGGFSSLLVMKHQEIDWDSKRVCMCRVSYLSHWKGIRKNQKAKNCT